MVQTDATMARDSRDKIVRAALEALRTKGFAGASARTMAALAGGNPGLIFYYFASLDELLPAALRESSQGAWSAVPPPRPCGRRASSSRCGVASTSRTRPADTFAWSRRWSPAASRARSSAAASWRSGALGDARRRLGRARPHRVAIRRAGLPARDGARRHHLLPGRHLVTHMGQATETVESLLESVERLAGMLDLLGPRSEGEGEDARL
jgi:AcrR family transcriptional regulator